MGKSMLPALILIGAAWAGPSDQDLAKNLGLEEQKGFLELSTKKLHQMSGHVELSQYMDLRRAALQGKDYDAGENISHFAAKSLGTRYALDSRSFDLHSANCITWTERNVALGLTDNWQDAYRLQNRLRYKDGSAKKPRIKNHRTLEDWVENNRWLWEDITEQLGVATDEMRWFTREGATLEPRTTRYITKETIAAVKLDLRSGDIVLLIGGDPNSAAKTVAIGHVGIVSVSPVNGAFLLDCSPADSGSALLANLVQELRDSRGLLGFKFVRIRPKARDLVAGELGRMKMAAPAPATLDQQLTLRYDELITVDGKVYAKKSIHKGDTLWSLFGPKWHQIIGLPMNRELRKNVTWTDGRVTDVKEGTVVFFPWTGE